MQYIKISKRKLVGREDGSANKKLISEVVMRIFVLDVIVSKRQ